MAQRDRLVLELSRETKASSERVIFLEIVFPKKNQTLG